MNALQKDLIKLTAAAEKAAPPKGPWGLQLHLMPPTGWLNDPNGLCFFRGEYHVFYQYSPFDASGGVKFWGHYKSRDLLSWEQCPVMLYSDETYDTHGAYSGSALCEEDGLYLYYTGNIKHTGDYDFVLTGREQNTAVAYSPDGVHLGWKRPLMDNRDYPAGLSLHVRDPKVWKQGGRYYMLQGARTAGGQGEALVFASDDKFHWEHINTLRTPEPFGYMWECPDLFELDGQWFLLVSPQGVTERGPGFENVYTSGYFPLYGDFRGEYTLGAFVPLDFGFDFYAPQTFSDGRRRLLIGWLGMPDADYSNPTADAQGWQHCLTVPREVSCRDGRLLLTPVRELEGLRKARQGFPFAGEYTIEDLPPASDIWIACEDGLAVDFSGVSLQAADGALTLTVREGGCGRETRTAPIGQLRSLRILADTSALEIFVNDGEAVLSTRWYPEGETRTLTLRGQGRAVIDSLRPIHIERRDRFS